MTTTRRKFLEGISAMGGLALAGPLLKGCATTLEDKLRNTLVERRLCYETIAHEFLDIETGFGVTDTDYRALDEIINEAKERINEIKLDKPFTEYTKKEAIKVLETIDEIIDGKGFAKKANDLLNKGLKDKKLDCDNRTIVYLAIANVLNLPLKAVDVPRHAFVRWHKDKKTCFNWETMFAQERSDSHYIAKYNLPDISIKNGAFLKSLSKEETYSFAYRIRGIAFAERKQYQKALKNYNKALEFNPKDPSTHHNKSITLHRLKRDKEALESADKALELYPTFASAYSIKGNIFLESKKYDKALETYDKALDAYTKNIAAYSKAKDCNKKYKKLLNRKKSQVYYNKGLVLFGLKRYEEAIQCNDEALKLKSDYTNALKNKELALKMLKKAGK